MGASAYFLAREYQCSVTAFPPLRRPGRPSRLGEEVNQTFPPRGRRSRYGAGKAWTPTRRVGPPIALAAAVSVGLVACGSSTPSPSPSASPPTPTTSSTASPSPSPSNQKVAVRLYFMNQGRIAVTYRQDARSPAPAQAAIRQLLKGPSTLEAGSGLVTQIPSGTTLRSLNLKDGQVTIDFSSTFAQPAPAAAMVARLAQVTFTLTQFSTVSRVVFWVDGRPTSAFSAYGFPSGEQVSRDRFESITPAILVEWPGNGFTVTNPFVVWGTANVFEAQLNLELRSASGAVLADQSILASSGSGTRGSFSTSVQFPASAAGPATLTVYDISAKDGSRIDVVQVHLNLSW